MHIKTSFNVGDIVYAVGLNKASNTEDRYIIHAPDEILIRGIEILVDSEPHGEIYFAIYYLPFPAEYNLATGQEIKVNSNDVYITREACQKRCDYLNKSSEEAHKKIIEAFYER